MRACRAGGVSRLASSSSRRWIYGVGDRPCGWLPLYFSGGRTVGRICGFKSRTLTHIITNGYVNAEEAQRHFLCRPPACVHLFYGFTPCAVHYSAERAPHKRNENARPIKIHAAVYLWLRKLLQHQANALDFVYSGPQCLLRRGYQPRAFYSWADLH